jgi:hypothetical protein
MSGTNSEARKRKLAEKTALDLAIERIAVLEGALEALLPALNLFVDEYPESAPLGDVVRKACGVIEQALVWRPKEV